MTPIENTQITFESSLWGLYERSKLASLSITEIKAIFRKEDSSERPDLRCGLQRLRSLLALKIADHTYTRIKPQSLGYVPVWVSKEYTALINEEGECIPGGVFPGGYGGIGTEESARLFFTQLDKHSQAIGLEVFYSSSRYGAISRVLRAQRCNPSQYPVNEGFTSYAITTI